MATSLVTGGAGFIGSSIVEALLAKGERVRVLDDFSSGRKENLQGLKGALEVVEGTIVDPTTVQRAAQGVDVIFHEAAIPSVARSVENPLATMKAGVIGTTNVLDAAREARVRRVVFAASSSVYGDTPVLPKVETMVPAPLSPYAVSKLVCEHMMRVYASLFGLETVSLRYFNVFGPKQDPKSEYAAAIPKFMTAAIKNKRPTVFGDGEQTRDFCYIDNVVAVNLLAASTPKKLAGEVVNVACGKRISINQLIRHIGEEAKAAGCIPAGASFEPVYEPARPGDVRDSLANITAAHNLLGFEPKVQVQDGLKTTFQAFLKFTK
jgi:UDP-N-acetylglucosamine/UDP-N-acetyl-alpha-D-glucosaminouronate 4-epimerase